MHEKPMVLVTIYPDGWVETRATDDVAVKIHSVPVFDNRGISGPALRQAFADLPWKWQKLIGETDARGVGTGMAETMPEAERYEQAQQWAIVEQFAAAVEADDQLRLDLVQVDIPEWMREARDRATQRAVAERWRDAYE